MYSLVLHIEFWCRSPVGSMGAGNALVLRDGWKGIKGLKEKYKAKEQK
jgi:hypothetical protein